MIARAPVLYWFCGLGALIVFLRFAAAYLSKAVDAIAGAASADASAIYPDLPVRGPSTFFLAVNSRSDEAYQLLQGVLNVKNPLRRIPLEIPQIVRDAATLARQFDRSVFGAEDVVSRAAGLTTLAILGAVAVHLWSGYLIPGDWLATLVASYAVLGGVSLASALRGVAVPVRLFVTSYIWLTGVARTVVSAVLLNRMWSTVRGYVLGTSGAPFATDGLAVSRGDRERPVLGAPLFYEELPADVVARVIAGRDRGVSENIQRVLCSVDTPDALADAFKALKETATNPTMMHTAYYKEQMVIQLVAQWIAGPPEERLARKGIFFVARADTDHQL